MIERVFTTNNRESISHNYHFAGVTTIFPEKLGPVFEYIKWFPDKLPRPHNGTAVQKLSNGPTVIITNVYGRTSGCENSKAGLFNKLISKMKELKTAFNASPTIVMGNFNIDLDTVNKSNRLSVQALNLLISDHCLVDSYRICPPDISISPGYTYTGRADQKSSRIDGIFISHSMASKCQNLECEVNPKHLIDHKTDLEGVNLKIRWTIGGMPDDVKPPWKFRNHLLELPAFCKEMKSGIMETLTNKLLETHSDQIPLVKKDFRFIQTEMLESTLIKASSRMQIERKIDSLDTIYECFNSIKITQQLEESKDRSSEN